MIRYLKQQEKEKTKEIYQDNFPKDRMAFVEYYYRDKIADNQILVMEEDEEIQTMLHLNPYLFQLADQQQILHYVVAVATAKQWQKQGKMRKVMSVALCDMAQEGIPFTFLIPADEKMYRSSGFSFVKTEDFSHMRQKWQEWEKETLLAAEVSLQIFVEEADIENIEKVVGFVERFLEKHYHIYPVVNLEVYQRKIRELETDGGGILLFRKEDKILGICSYGSDDREVFLQDFLVEKEQEEEIFFLLQDYFQGKKMILQDMNYMVRILDLERFCVFLKSDAPKTFRLEVQDSVIAKNNGCFQICVTKDGGSCTSISKEEVEESITIGEVASRLLEGMDTYIREWV